MEIAKDVMRGDSHLRSLMRESILIQPHLLEIDVERQSPKRARPTASTSTPLFIPWGLSPRELATLTMRRR